MTWEHLRAFLWLRWRLMANHWRRSGALNAALMIAVAALALVAAVPLFVGCFALGVYAIPRAEPAHLMYAWDGLIAAFLLFWAIGLAIDLQRNDPLALSRFLHLPVPLTAAFLINYVSSSLRLSLLVFGPIMAAFALSLVYVKGAAMLPVLPSLAAFLLMVTALTYQFQGWLASLMSNPRRRRTVVAATMAAIILLAQLPNLLNLTGVGVARQRAERSSAHAAELAGLQRAFEAGEFDAHEHLRRQESLIAVHKAAEQRAAREDAGRLERVARIANTAVPPGWLPLGVMASAEGRPAPGLLGMAGMTLIGAASLWRAYRTTMGLYRGQHTGRKAAGPVPTTAASRGRRALLVEARLPGLSEPASAVATAGLRSLLRSPEAKMALLTPVILGVVFGAMLFRGRAGIPGPFRPLIGASGMVFGLFGLLQLMGNQFGVDRDGFRTFVLSAAPRRDILLGKNLAHAPAALALSAVAVAVVQALCPMRPDHLLAMLPLGLSMFLVLCVLANLFSIETPVFIPAGSLKAPNPKLSTVLLQLALGLVLFPLGQGATLLPFGVEAALHTLGRADGIPVALLLSLAECAAVVGLYRVSLRWLGARLQAREQHILETVTNRLV